MFCHHIQKAFTFSALGPRAVSGVRIHSKTVCVHTRPLCQREDDAVFLSHMTALFPLVLKTEVWCELMSQVLSHTQVSVVTDFRF